MLTEKELDNLQWAKDFMNRYERKHRMKYTFKNKSGDVIVLTEEEVRDLLIDNGDMPDEIVVPKSAPDTSYFRIK